MTANAFGAVAVSVPAKINLSLGVGTNRPDGFHALATVYQAIGLYDRVTVREADDVSVAVNPDSRVPVADVPVDQSNIAVRAARLLADHAGVDPMARGESLGVEEFARIAEGLGLR